MKCPYCGNETSAGSAFCTVCGRSISAQPAAAPARPDFASQVAEQHKAAKRRALKHKLLFALAVAVATLIGLTAFIMNFGGSDAGSVQEGTTPSETAAGGDVATPATLRDFVGTWICDEYDYNGTIRTFQVAFDDQSYCYFVISKGDAVAYAASRTYSGSDGVLRDSSGFEFTLSDDGQSIVLHVDPVNQQYQMQSEYVFERASAESFADALLLNSYGWWNPSDTDDGNPAFYLDRNGFLFFDVNETSSNTWEIRDDKLVLVLNGEERTEHYFSYSVDGSELTEDSSGAVWTHVA